jgi:hypothetical protein
VVKQTKKRTGLIPAKELIELTTAMQKSFTLLQKTHIQHPLSCECQFCLGGRLGWKDGYDLGIKHGKEVGENIKREFEDLLYDSWDLDAPRLRLKIEKLLEKQK